VLAITAAILERLGKPPSLIRHVEDRPGHDRRYAVDQREADQRDRLAPRHSFEQGIADTIDWYGARRDWWEPIKAGEFRAYYEKMYGQRKVLSAEAR
jgi:dTDP-glucose 4,6-dehydratase